MICQVRRPANTLLAELLGPLDSLPGPPAVAVANILRTAIARGVLPPGTPLRQDHVAAYFQLSHIPIREALQQLVADGLASFSRNRGIVVSTLSPSVARELMEFRRVIEGQMALWAVPQLTPPALGNAEIVLRRLDEAEDIDEVLDLNAEFHSIIYRAAERPFFMAEIDRVRINLRRYWRSAWLDLHYKPVSQAEHWLILNACRNCEPELAADLIKEHISKTSDLIVGFLSKQERKHEGKGAD